jgi:hypothetical protein
MFDLIKGNVSQIRPTAYLSTHIKQLLRILGALQTALLPPTIIHVFAQAGIVSPYCVQHECLICAVNPTVMRSVQDQNQAPARGNTNSLSQPAAAAFQFNAASAKMNHCGLR